MQANTHNQAVLIPLHMGAVHLLHKRPLGLQLAVLQEVQHHQALGQAQLQQTRISQTTEMT